MKTACILGWLALFRLRTNFARIRSCAPSSTSVRIRVWLLPLFCIGGGANEVVDAVQSECNRPDVGRPNKLLRCLTSVASCCTFGANLRDDVRQEKRNRSELDRTKPGGPAPLIPVLPLLLSLEREGPSVHVERSDKEKLKKVIL
jgi:hypothetical protein